MVQGNTSTQPRVMSRHIMWHELHAVRQENRGRLSDKRDILSVERQILCDPHHLRDLEQPCEYAAGLDCGGLKNSSIL
jgi:hypothetical protein